MFHDCIRDSPSIQTLNTLRVTIPQKSVILQILDIVTNFLPLNPRKEQININMFVYHLDAWHKSLSHQHQFLHTLILFLIRHQNLRKHPKEVIISIYIARCDTQGINIRTRRVHVEPVGSKLEDLSAPGLDLFLVFAEAAAALLDPITDYFV